MVWLYGLCCLIFFWKVFYDDEIYEYMLFVVGWFGVGVGGCVGFCGVVYWVVGVGEGVGDGGEDWLCDVGDFWYWLGGGVV